MLFHVLSDFQTVDFGCLFLPTVTFDASSVSGNVWRFCALLQKANCDFNQSEKPRLVVLVSTVDRCFPSFGSVFPGVKPGCAYLGRFGAMEIPGHV